MRGHEAVRAGLDGGQERHEVHGVHLAPVGVDDGQPEVGVHGGVALAREVLGAGGDARRLEPPDPRGAEAGDQRGVLAVGADADVRAVALGEHVEDGAEAHVHAQSAQLAALDAPLAGDEADLARRPRGEVVGEDRDTRAEHDDAPALVVGGDEQSAPERALEAGQHGVKSLGALEVAPVEDEAAGAGFLEEAEIGIRDVRPGQAEHEPPPDHRFEVHGAARASGVGRARQAEPHPSGGPGGRESDGTPAFRRSSVTFSARSIFIRDGSGTSRSFASTFGS